MRRVIGIGETILDILFKNNQPTVAVPGGSVFNGLVSLGRAGANVTFISEVGGDHVGDIILNFMKENGINTDSVMVYPDKKIGIVCVPINEKGVLRVQLPNKKIWINHKRVKLYVAATELYPEDYDFSIIFDTVENRKKRHDMDRKYTDAVIELEK